MPGKLIIVMANTDPRNGEELGAPIFQATVAAAGVKFYCCSPNLDLFDMSKDDLIPECSGIVGGAHLIEEVMETDAKVLTY